MSEARTRSEDERPVTVARPPASRPAAPSPAAKAWRYFPELDGLRTIAVLAVFCFHLDRRLLPGGFVGVDIFFVISGFLISSILLQDIDRHQFSIVRFYQHRIARIAPALFLVLIVSLIAGFWCYSAQDFARVGANAAVAAISLINMKLLFQNSYFQASQDAQPLLHCWSLAVEEQFYLLFPPFIYAAARYCRWPMVLTLLLCAASFALCVVVTRASPVAAFYLLPTRAWELLAGCALALFRRAGGTIRQPAAATLGWAGLATIGLSFFAVRDTDAFPGWIVAAPVVGAAMVVAAVGSAEGAFSRLLAHPAAVYVGKRSYSLYLWHWPVFSFVDYALFAASPALRLFLKITLSLLGALITYRALETPARRFLKRPSHRMLAFAAFGVFAGGVLALGSYVRAHDYLSAIPGSITSGGMAVNPGGRRSVVVVGDSQGAMYGAEFAAIARQRGFRLNVLSESGLNELPGESDTLWPKVQTYLGRHHADVIIVAEAWMSKYGNDPAALRRAIEALEPYATRIVILAQPPVPPANSSREGIRAGARQPFFEPSNDRLLRQRSMSAINGIVGGKVQALDVSDAFLNQDGSVRVFGPDGRLAYEDSHHLTDTGTTMVHGRLEAAVMAALD